MLCQIILWCFIFSGEKDAVFDFYHSILESVIAFD